jgi:hypothetical protein
VESLPSDAIEIEPVALVVTSDPRPSIKIGGVEVVQALSRLEVVLDGTGAVALLELRVDVEWDFPVREVLVPGSGLDGLTASEIESVWLSAGYSESPARALLEYLRSRVAGVG